MLVPCRACGKEVGESASKCPHCGTRTPNRKRKMRSNILYGILILLAVLFAKQDDWFIKNAQNPDGLPLLGITILIILLVIIFWLLFKSIADLFK